MLRVGVSVYTMHMGRKSAWLMMVLVAFWAAMPALAYLRSAQADACCRQMAQACGSCEMSASQSCCQVHAPDTSVPLGRSTPVERLIPPMQMVTGQVLPVLVACGASSCHTVEASPPSPRPGSSVLRI